MDLIISTANISPDQRIEALRNAFGRTYVQANFRLTANNGVGPDTSISGGQFGRLKFTTVHSPGFRSIRTQQCLRDERDCCYLSITLAGKSEMRQADVTSSSEEGRAQFFLTSEPYEVVSARSPHIALYRGLTNRSRKPAAEGVTHQAIGHRNHRGHRANTF